MIQVLFILVVVADTTKVRIFKQITTSTRAERCHARCCWYHKGTNFQANHNFRRVLTHFFKLLLIPQRYEFSSKSQLIKVIFLMVICCCWYHKGTNFQANHNNFSHLMIELRVVADTTKVRIFKQITTEGVRTFSWRKLLLIPQRYEFSSKSQLKKIYYYGWKCCCWYHKGTNFQANHNSPVLISFQPLVVADTTKVRIFKQITTYPNERKRLRRCCWYHKGTNFQANHNVLLTIRKWLMLLLIPQRYEFSSKSQLGL